MNPRLKVISGFVSALVVIAMAVGCGQNAPQPTPTPAPTPTPETAFGLDHQPNILVIVTDDQRYDTMEFMPETQKLLFDRGISFSNAFATTPLCCPSRATILTGMYGHSHNVRTNSESLLRETMVDRLRAAGYYTGMIGKYLNSWEGSPRPEFDYWIGSPLHEYNDPRLNVNGEWKVVEGYQTTIFGDYAERFLRRAAREGRPWMLYFATHAPHAPAIPEEKYKDLYADLPPFRPPAFDEEDLSDKPFADRISPLTTGQIAYNDYFRTQQLRTLKSVDDQIARIISALDEQGMLEDTAIFFISDNGMLLGEHRLAVTKAFPYEASIRLPFAFSFPRLNVQPRTIDALVGNIDIAPTIYQLAGIPQPEEVEGMSLIPLIRDQGPWRDYLLIEAWGARDASPDDPINDLGSGKGLRYPYIAVRTDRYILIQSIGFDYELYDLEKDPNQLQNVYSDPAYADIAAGLQAQLDFLRGPFMTSLADEQATLTQAAISTPAP